MAVAPRFPLWIGLHTARPEKSAGQGHHEIHVLGYRRARLDAMELIRNEVMGNRHEIVFPEIFPTRSEVVTTASMGTQPDGTGAILAVFNLITDIPLHPGVRAEVKFQRGLLMVHVHPGAILHNREQVNGR